MFIKNNVSSSIKIRTYTEKEMFKVSQSISIDTSSFTSRDANYIDNNNNINLTISNYTSSLFGNYKIINSNSDIYTVQNNNKLYLNSGSDGGNCQVVVSSPLGSVATNVFLFRNSRTWITKSFVQNSLCNNLYQAADELITGLTPPNPGGTDPYAWNNNLFEEYRYIQSVTYVSSSRVPTVIVRNPTNWLTSKVDYTWEQTSGATGAWALVTPYHAIMAQHVGYSTNDPICFVDNNNNIYKRYLKTAVNVPGTDIVICVLSSDTSGSFVALTSSITPVKLFPKNWRNYIPSQNIPSIPLYSRSHRAPIGTPPSVPPASPGLADAHNCIGYSAPGGDNYQRRWATIDSVALVDNVHSTYATYSLIQSHTGSNTSNWDRKVYPDFFCYHRAGDSGGPQFTVIKRGTNVYEPVLLASTHTADNSEMISDFIDIINGYMQVGQPLYVAGGPTSVSTVDLSSFQTF